MLVMILALTVLLALIPFVNSAGVWGLLIVCGFIRGGGLSMINIMIIELKEVGGNYGGTALGLASSISMLGAFLAPPIGNSFADKDPGNPMLFWAVLSILALIPLYLRKTKD